jgi:hypothetical protein
VVSIDGTESRDFATIQGQHIDTFLAHHPNPETARVSQGLVVIPTDSATNDHAGFQRADEVAFALPFTFAEADYRQIITDLAEKLGPRLDWTATQE